MEKYIQRLNELQDIAMGMPGVSEAYAIQAGREVRVMVDAHRVNDDEAHLIAQQIASGNLRVLGVASAKRTPQLPNVPTFAEAGVGGVEADAWSALFAPAKTPTAVIQRLYRAVSVALGKDSVKSTLEHQGLPVALKTPAEMSAMLPGEIEKWAAVIKLAHVTVE